MCFGWLVMLLPGVWQDNTSQCTHCKHQHDCIFLLKANSRHMTEKGAHLTLPSGSQQPHKAPRVAIAAAIHHTLCRLAPTALDAAHTTTTLCGHLTPCAPLL